MLNIKLVKGHSSDPSKKCTMAAVAWLNGEGHTDHPKCVCPVIAAYVRVINDRMPDDVRSEKMVEFVWSTPGTRGTLEDEQRRMFFFADAAVRKFAPDDWDSACQVLRDAIALGPCAPQEPDMNRMLEVCGALGR